MVVVRVMVDLPEVPESEAEEVGEEESRRRRRRRRCRLAGGKGVVVLWLHDVGHILAREEEEPGLCAKSSCSNMSKSTIGAGTPGCTSAAPQLASFPARSMLVRRGHGYSSEHEAI